MDWQELIVFSIVAATAAIFLLKKFRRKKIDFHSATGCGCSSPTKTNPGSSIVFHARKGERGRVIVKMK